MHDKCTKIQQSSIPRQYSIRRCMSTSLLVRTSPCITIRRAASTKATNLVYWKSSGTPTSGEPRVIRIATVRASCPVESRLEEVFSSSRTILSTCIVHSSGVRGIGPPIITPGMCLPTNYCTKNLSSFSPSVRKRAQCLYIAELRLLSWSERLFMKRFRFSFMIVSFFFFRRFTANSSRFFIESPELTRYEE